MSIFSKLNLNSSSSKVLNKEVEIFEKEYGYILDSIRQAVAPMRTFRNNEPFANYELMLGFMAFVFWGFGGRNIPYSVKESELQLWNLWYYDEGNDTSARECAIYTAELLSKSPSIVGVMSKIKPTLNFEEELFWAKNKLNPPEWTFCLTRAVILVTRGLAYQKSGRYKAPALYIKDEAGFAVEWALKYFSKEDVRFIYEKGTQFRFNLEK